MKKDNIHINEAETILKNNPLSLHRLKDKTNTSDITLKQNKNQAYQTSSRFPPTFFIFSEKIEKKC